MIGEESLTGGASYVSAPAQAILSGREQRLWPELLLSALGDLFPTLPCELDRQNSEGLARISLTVLGVTTIRAPTRAASFHSWNSVWATA